jgi:hypothetical protein
MVWVSYYLIEIIFNDVFSLYIDVKRENIFYKVLKLWHKENIEKTWTYWYQSLLFDCEFFGVLSVYIDVRIENIDAKIEKISV